MQFSKWYTHTAPDMPVDEFRKVQIQTANGPIDEPPLPANFFDWTTPGRIRYWRAELTADEIAEEEEWARVDQASKKG